MTPKKSKSGLSRREFLIYSTAATATVAGVVTLTDALANQEPTATDLMFSSDSSHTIYGYA